MKPGTGRFALALAVALSAGSCAQREEDVDVGKGIEESAAEADAALPPEAKSLTEIVSALETQGLGPVVEAELEDDCWEIDTFQDGKRIELRADLTTGQVLAGNEPRGGKPLSEILKSLEASGYGPFLDAEWRNGRWDIEAYKGGTTSVLAVDAKTGEIRTEE